jgi:trimethylamine:corrinoid methyltransferase-like protein
MWEKNGRLTLEDKAAREVDRILETHAAESLPEEVRETIASIVRREQAWIDNQQ